MTDKMPNKYSVIIIEQALRARCCAKPASLCPAGHKCPQGHLNLEHGRTLPGGTEDVELGLQSAWPDIHGSEPRRAAEGATTTLGGWLCVFIRRHFYEKDEK